jgi:Restriction endonuclease
MSVPAAMASVDGAMLLILGLVEILAVRDMARATRTLNPLHFEDLEPHRFEDLIRQLIYDFRHGRALEALGRSGSDQGIDIRGIELSGISDPNPEDEENDEEDVQPWVREEESEERVWIIQCKREKNIGPQKARSIITDFFSITQERPYGYILTAACDFSKAARDAFREEMISQGVQEFHIWGKAEIEDQLFLPKKRSSPVRIFQRLPSSAA